MYFQIETIKRNMFLLFMFSNKCKEPSLVKGIRTLFRKNNFNVFLVDEFRSNCDSGVCEKLIYCTDASK